MVDPAQSHPVRYAIRGLNTFYGATQSLRNIDFDIQANQILGVIGPSGSGKTTFLRILNRLNDLIPGFRIEGQVRLDGKDIYDPGYDVIGLRRRAGVVFALPVALPMSIYENVVYGPRAGGVRHWDDLDALVEKSLKSAFLWEEVKDRLDTSAMRLSGGQQQRLSLARVLALEPEFVLLDEPCSGLDPISTAKIEDALVNLKSRYTVVLVTNNTMQAARIADQTAFFLMGEMVESDATHAIFTKPRDRRTSDYITGRFG
ncbi:MAG TPA: phosphate ABC transporter ATP-binding protein [bacterium]